MAQPTLPHEERRFKIAHQEHRHRVVTAECVVDDLPPPLLTGYYLKVSNLTAGTFRLRQIIKDNKELVQKINEINRTKGKTDTHLRPYVRDEKFDKIMLPTMLRLQKHNKEIQKCLENTPPVYGYWEIYKEWKRNEKLIFLGSRFPEVLTREDQIRLGRRWSIEQISSTPEDVPKKPKNRPRVFMEFETSKGFYLGRMEFVLYKDVVPLTVDNFLSLCKGDNPEKLSYKGTLIFRVTPGLYCQGGDVTKKTGPGGKSIYGDVFDDENFQLQHAGPGVLSMCNFNSRDSNSSQFLITFRALHSLDGKNVVFGKLVSGVQTMYNLENLGTSCGKTTKEVIVTDCGEVIRKKHKKI